MKNYFILCLLIFVSCKNNSENSNKNNKKQTQNSVRKTISIKNETFHLKVDGRNDQLKVSDIFGEYTNDRFNKDKSCLFLDGISDFIEIDNIDEINSKKALTISIWYKPDSFKGVGQNSLVWKGFEGPEAPYCQYLISATGNLYHKSPGIFKFGLSINGKFHHVKTKENAWVPDQWYNITGTYNGVKMILYVNGKSVGERKISGEVNEYNTPVLIGKTPHKEFYTSGDYDDFRFFDRALSRKEVELIYSEK